MATIHISGAREMEMVLRQIPDYIAKKALNAALREAAKPILDEARALAPVGQQSKGRVRMRTTKRGKVSITNYGKLKLLLKIVTVPARLTSHSATVAVTVGKAFWGMWVEFGIPSRHIGARPFMRPAFEGKKMDALNQLGKALGEQIEKAAKKLAGPLAKSGLRR
jgi:HK97 gp10 family phage protein